MRKNRPNQVSRSIRIGNPIHLEACRQGYKITKNKKKYTRKVKYKNKDMEMKG